MLITLVYRIAARKNFIKMKGMLSKINGFLRKYIRYEACTDFPQGKEKKGELENLDREYFKSAFAK